MVLNYIWISFFILAFLVAIIKLFFFGDTQIFSDLFNSVISSSKTGFEISLGLTGVLAFWLGIVKVGEKGGRASEAPGMSARAPLDRIVLKAPMGSLLSSAVTLATRDRHCGH